MSLSITENERIKEIVITETHQIPVFQKFETKPCSRASSSIKQGHWHKTSTATTYLDLLSIRCTFLPLHRSVTWLFKLEHPHTLATPDHHAHCLHCATSWTILSAGIIVNPEIHPNWWLFQMFHTYHDPATFKRNLGGSIIFRASSWWVEIHTAGSNLQRIKGLVARGLCFCT